MGQEQNVALVTGAGSGIGAATALALHQAGYAVVLAGRREQALAAVAAQEVPTAPPMRVVPTDVSDPTAVAALFALIRAEYGRLDLLFNNAGITAPSVPLDELTVGQWTTVVAVNLNGAFFCAREAVRLMKEQRPQGGRIINNGSLSAHTPRPHSAPYTATKHALTGLTKALALDGRAFNIACGQIDIGNAATEMTHAMTEGVLQANGEVLVEPRIEVQHVADAVLYMARLPLHANVLFMTVMATAMPFVGRG